MTGHHLTSNFSYSIKGFRQLHRQRLKCLHICVRAAANNRRLTQKGEEGMARAGGVTGGTVVLTTIAVSPLLPLLPPPYVTCISCGMKLPRLPNDQPKDKGENTKRSL